MNRDQFNKLLGIIDRSDLPVTPEVAEGGAPRIPLNANPDTLRWTGLIETAAKFQNKNA